MLAATVSRERLFEAVPRDEFVEVGPTDSRGPCGARHPALVCGHQRLDVPALEFSDHRLAGSGEGHAGVDANSVAPRGLIVAERQHLPHDETTFEVVAKLADVAAPCVLVELAE